MLTKLWIFGVDQFNVVVQTYPRPTYVAMVTKFWYLNAILLRL